MTSYVSLETVVLLVSISEFFLDFRFWLFLVENVDAFDIPECGSSGSTLASAAFSIWITSFYSEYD